MIRVDRGAVWPLAVAYYVLLLAACVWMGRR
jgi:hypothetical protein